MRGQVDVASRVEVQGKPRAVWRAAVDDNFGISAAAASLAGHLHLANLCWVYDNNRITIEGRTSLAFTEDVATRFIGYGWNVTGSATPTTPRCSGVHPFVERHSFHRSTV